MILCSVQISNDLCMMNQALNACLSVFVRFTLSHAHTLKCLRLYTFVPRIQAYNRFLGLLALALLCEGVIRYYYLYITFINVIIIPAEYRIQHTHFIFYILCCVPSKYVLYTSTAQQR